MVGTAQGISSDLLGSNFDDQGGEVAGTIKWTFDSNAQSALNVGSMLTMTFLDKDFGVGGSGADPNEWNTSVDPHRLTLWGADGYTGMGSAHGYQNPTLGTDLVIKVDPVPEPATLALVISGVGAVCWRARKRAKVKGK